MYMVGTNITRARTNIIGIQVVQASQSLVFITNILIISEKVSQCHVNIV